MPRVIKYLKTDVKCPLCGSMCKIDNRMDKLEYVCFQPIVKVDGSLGGSCGSFVIYNNKVHWTVKKEKPKV